FSFFFLSLRRPLRSTLFPYTTLFRSWHNNIIAFAPQLETSVAVSTYPIPVKELPTIRADRRLIGTWSAKTIALPDGGTFVTGIGDRKSTRLNSSHLVISYAVFCLKKK